MSPMMTNSDTSRPKLVLGFDLDAWNQCGERLEVTVDLSPENNSHLLVCGMSGSGKSYLENGILAKLALCEPNGEIHFADYKGDNAFAYLRGCPRYYAYKDTLNALEIVHNRLLARQSGEDSSTHPVTLIWDEYMAQVLSLLSEDKKAAAAVMNRVSEILLLGRSLSVRLVMAIQRPDALAFPAGSRLNYGVVVVLGSSAKSIYEMLLPDFKDELKGRTFKRGEGVVLFQGSELRYLKVPVVGNPRRMEQLCIKALSASCPPSEA